MKTKVLVTGANGQLARTIKELYQTNKDGIVFDFLSKEQLDITSAKAVTTYFKNQQPEYCINCAAYTNVEQAEQTPEQALLVNKSGVENLVEACLKTNTTLLHISTDYVFDGTKKTPYTINDTPNPINEYGKSKLEGEESIKKKLQKYFIIRTSWLYSKKYGSNFYKTILKAAKTKTKIEVTDAQIGTPTNTETVAKFCYNLIKTKAKNYGIFHVTDSTVMTWHDFACKIIEENKLTKNTILVKTNKYRTFAERPKYSVLKTEK